MQERVLLHILWIKKDLIFQSLFAPLCKIKQWPIKHFPLTRPNSSLQKKSSDGVSGCVLVKVAIWVKLGVTVICEYSLHESGSSDISPQSLSPSQCHPAGIQRCDDRQRKLSTIENIKYKKAFQSKAHLPLADKKSNTYNLTLVWPWPQTSQTKLNWCSGSKISIFHEITLTLIQ